MVRAYAPYRCQVTTSPWGRIGLSARLHTESGVSTEMRRPVARLTARVNATSQCKKTVGASARGRTGGRVIGASFLQTISCHIAQCYLPRRREKQTPLMATRE